MIKILWQQKSKKAQANLGTRTLIDEDAIVEAVMLAAGHPEDDKVVGRLEKETRTRIKKGKLHELSFKPDRKILRQPYMRRIVMTEGVTILFPDRAENPNVKVVELEGGKVQIIVDTDRVTEDSVVTPKAGQPT
ncbi:hypothetical protein [Pseudomonas sp. S2_A05]